MGRKAEKAVLQRCLDSAKPEFLAVYGRRRVGKTFLVREYLRDQIVFALTGAAKTPYQQQLRLFDEALQEWTGRTQPRAKDWFEAFRLLKEHIKHFRHQRKKVVFLDEVPWLATQRSGFVAALDHFWNSFGATRPDLLLIICGSASSWIIDSVIKDRGGLHNRITRQLWIEPFTLSECEAYYRSRGIALNRFQITQLYSVLGGIPYYMDYADKGLSPEQIIDSMFFAKGAPLSGEFHNLYGSLFKNPARHLRIVEALGKRAGGLTQQQLLAELKIKPGGSITKALRELEQCGFICRWRDFTKPRSGHIYQLTDFYTLFYLKHIRPAALPDAAYWQTLSRKGGWNAWQGIAFERVCAAHIPQIKARLGIAGVHTEAFGWRSRAAAPGAQIDLVISRDDSIVDLCEVKFTAKPLAVDAVYDQALTHKLETFREETGTKKALHTVMISASGLTPKSYRGAIQALLTLDDLFAE
ncbi:MAG: AAA family ATPase [Bifidobacteriaceae bacterium]|nr:AAA family ATPase [Bifidobacteriaceae bacterium]